MLKKIITVATILAVSLSTLQAVDLENGKQIINNANIDCQSDAKASWEFMFDNAMVSGLEDLSKDNKEDAKAYCMKYASDGLRIEK